jgi:hypothetical protein
MTDKTDVTDSSESRLKVEDLTAPEQELSSEEMGEVRGGDYVQGLYRDLLGRQPGQVNINSVTGVAPGGSTGGDRSDSSRGDAVSDVYNDLLNRPKP